MSENNEQIELKNLSDLRARFRNACCMPNLFFLENKIKENRSLKKEYSGRELMELIQNADDAYSLYLKSDPNAKKNTSVKIVYDGKWLSVYNKGLPFTFETINRLCIGGASSKEGVIGCKGKGFRSLLNFSENIYIQSGEYAFCFSREKADAELEQIKSNSEVQKAFRQISNPKYPIFLVPTDIEKEYLGEWNTVIKMKLFDDSDVRASIEKQIDEFDSVTLLFLPTVSSLEIEKKNIKFEYQKEKKEDHLFSVSRIENGNEKNKNSYYFFEEKKNVIWNESIKEYEDYVEEKDPLENENDKKDELKILHNAVAIPVREENFHDAKNVYSYFAIREEKSPFYAILHSTFLLSENRDSIVQKTVDGSENKSIARSLLKFYVKTIQENFLTQEFGDYAMLLLTPIGFYISEYEKNKVRESFLSAMDLLDEYVKMLKPLNFFFTVNKKFIDNSPEYIDENIKQIPESFIGTNFEKLIPPIQEKQRQSVFSFLTSFFGLRVLSAVDICEKINTIAESLDSRPRMKLFHWWKSKLCKVKAKECAGLKPIVVKTEQGNLIGDVDQCYLTGGSITEIPQWASITVIDPEDEANLLDLYKDEIEQKIYLERIFERKSNPSSPKRILANFTGLREQSNLLQVVTDVNESVKKTEQAKEFIGWLYRVYLKMPTDSKDKLCGNDSLVVPVATDSGFCEKNKAYIGSAYGNSIGDPICKAVGLNPLVDFSSLKDTSFEDIETALNFFEKLQIVKYPKLHQINCDNIPYCIWQFLGGKVSKPEKCRDWMIRVAIKDGNPFNPQKIKEKVKEFAYSHVLFIKNFQKILSLKTKDIFKWMLNDSKFYDAVCSDVDSGAELYYEMLISTRGGVGKCKIKTDNVPNFLQYYLSTENWININESKQNIVSTTKDSIESQSWYNELIAEGYEKKLSQLLQKLGLKGDNFSLNPEDFYRMLLAWGNDEKNGREALKLYSKIADPKNREFLTDKIQSSCYLKERFKKNGFVWAVNRDGDAKFILAKEAYFTSSAVLNFENRFLIKTPARVGQYEVFNAIFGVNKYEEKIIIKTKSESPNNQKFQKDFKEFLPYFLSLRSNITSDAIKIARNLKITLLDLAKIDVNGHEYSLDKKDYAANSNDFPVLQESASSWYVVIGSSEYRQNGEILQALKTIFYVAFNHPSDEYLDICENLFAVDEKQRKKKLKEKNISDEDFNNVRNSLNNTIDYKKIFIEKFDSKLDDDAKRVIDSIQFEDIHCTGNVSKFQQLIEMLGVSVEIFNKTLGINLSFVKLNRNRLESAFGKMEPVVRQFYVEKLANQSVEEQMKLDFYVENARREVQKDIPNEIPFDENTELETRLKLLGIEDLTKALPENIYKENVEKLREKVGKEGNDSFDNNLLYFNIDWSNEDDPLAKKLLELFNKPETAPEEIDPGKIQRLGGAEYVGIINASSHKGSSSTGSAVGGGTHQGDKPPKLSLADSAEYEVYEQIREQKIPKIAELAGKYTPEDVKWRSGAAHRKLKTRGNDRLGYDMEIHGESCILHIEVKSSTDLGCSFLMSSNEMENACKDENYAIIFVGGVASEKPQIQFIGNPFLHKTMTLSGEKSPFTSSIEKYRIDYRGDENAS